MPRSGQAEVHTPFPTPSPLPPPWQHITNAFVISHNVNLYSVQSKQIVQKKNKNRKGVIHTV